MLFALSKRRRSQSVTLDIRANFFFGRRLPRPDWAAHTSAMTWWMYGLLSALAAAATAILAKVGVKDVPSNLATALRTLVVLVFAWGIVLLAGEHHSLREIKGRSLGFLVLSGIGTGASWLAYFKALQMAPAVRVAPIDKLSLGFTLLLAATFLGETVTWQVALGTGLMVAGALLTLAG